MKVIFLDFDGVLNSVGFLNARSDPRQRLDPTAVARLNAIVDRSGAKVVVTSGWRLKRSLAELRARLAEVGFCGEVIDVTPALPASVAASNGFFPARCDEIQAWLDARPEPLEGFVILDDADFEPGAVGRLERRLVRTELETGLRDEHVALALESLDDPCSERGRAPGP